MTFIGKMKDHNACENIIGLHEFTTNKSLWKMLIAEFLGTLILVAIGCGSTIGPDANTVQIALTFGLTVGALVQAIGHVSGCHINPAISVSLFVSGHINLMRCILYVFVQCIGAIAGSALLKVLLPTELVGSLGLTAPNATYNISQMQAVGFEIMLAFVFILTVHGVCDEKSEHKSSAPIVVGLTLAAVHLSGIQFTGTGVNPARSLGPAVVLNRWENHWIYWIGPLIGGILAGLVYKLFFKGGKVEKDSYDL